MATAVRAGLAVEQVGTGPQRVVFVHGVLDRGRSFRRVAAKLASECSMEWYDRRGYGGSLDAPGSPVDVAGHAGDLVAVLDDRPAVVVGHSFGGVIVLAAAQRAPELFSAVVLYETGMCWLPGWDDRVLRALLWGDDPEGMALQLMLGAHYGRLKGPELAIRRREATAFVVEERSVRDGGPAPDVAAVRAPLVFGHSERWPEVVVDHVRHAVPGADVVELPGADHNAHRSQPGPFADLVRRGVAAAGT